MKIAIDVSPIENQAKLAHRVRGTGFYIKYLKEALLKYHPENSYLFFSDNSELPKDVDIVHYPYFEPFFLTLSLLKKHKTVVTVHDLIPLVFPEHFPAGIKGELVWSIQKILFRNVDVIITDSVFSKKDIARFTGIGENRIHVIYLAAGEEFKRIHNSESRFQKLRNKYKLPDKFVLYVGDATWNKNLPRLIKAIQKINVPLVMVGKALLEKDFNRKNPWNQDLVKVQELANDDKRIIRLGFVPTDDLVILYNMATVFAMPSLYEGFGLPVLEAMASGCPVLTSDRGSLKEVAGDAALYVNPQDIDNIAKNLEVIARNSELRSKFIEKGLKQAEKFSWKKTAEETIKVYEKKS